MISEEAMKVAAQINKRLGAGTVVRGNEIVLPTRITSGSLALDLVLGGGWPVNQWAEIVGEASHGKTAIALKTIAANQKKNPDFTAVWIAAEPWSSQYAELCGVDTQRVLVVETNIMEEAYEAAINFCESKGVDLIVIDSLPALVPGAENDKDMDEMTVGRGALLTNKFFRKVGKATKRSLIEEERGVTGILINQFRMKIGVMHGDPRTTPGGLGKDYAMAIRAEVKRDDWIEIGPSGNKKRIGQTIRVRTIKNKTFPPQQSAFFDFYMAEGGSVTAGDYDFAKEIVSLSILTSVVDRRGGWIYYGERKWQGAEALLNSLREEIDLAEEITGKVMDSLKNELPVSA
jgi:recombination protein RecA